MPSVGIATLGVVSSTLGLMFATPSASASTVEDDFGPLPVFCYESIGGPDSPGALLPPNVNGDGVMCGDKVFSNFNFTQMSGAPFDIREFDIVINVGGNWEVDFLGPLGGIGGQTDFMLTYDVAIKDEYPDYFFHEVELDSTVGADGVTITKEVFTDSDQMPADLLVTLTSIDGEPDASKDVAGLRFLSIKDTVSILPGGSLDDFENDFIQKRTVPEPTTMLGLLAFGGLGLAMKRKKQ